MESVLGLLPLLALQIRTVADTAEILTRGLHHQVIAITFCVIITLFTLLFGAKPLTTQYKHDGLVVAIAVESVIKLTMMLVLSGFALYSVFGGPAGLEQWLTRHPDALELLYLPLKESGIWHSMILAFLFSAVVMPYMYHMVFTENFQPRALLTASWGLPFYLFLMALGIPVILWAGIKLSLVSSPEYFSLGVAMAGNQPWLPLLVFVGGMAAASGTIMVTSLALSSMVLNHLVLPFTQPAPAYNLYHWLIWVRRGLIILITALAYTFYRQYTGSAKNEKL